MKTSQVRKLLVLASLLAVTACESKFSEPSPKSVPVNSNIDDNIKAGESLDQKLERLQQSAQSVKNVIALFMKAEHKNPSSVYTPFDLVFDLSAELKKSIAHENKTLGSYQKEGQFTLPVPGLSPQCKIVKTLFRSSTEDGNQGDDAVLSLKSCYTDDYQNALEARLTENEVTFNFYPQALTPLLVGVAGDMKASSNCRLENNDAQKLSGLNCQNIQIKVDKDEVLIKSMLYNATGNTRLDVTADVTGSDGQPKGSLHLKIDSDGNIDFDSDKAQAN